MEDYKDPKRSVPEPEEKKVADFMSDIDAFYQDNDQRFKDFEKNRKYWRGVVHKDDKPGLVRTNLIFSTMAAILPQIYAKAPDISCSPAPAVQGASNYGTVKRFGETLEAVLRTKFVKECNLKRRGKEAVRATMASGLGWAKLIYRENIERDPLIEQQLNDIQENLKRVEMLRSRLRRDDSIADNEKTQEELKQAIAGLAEKVEVVSSRGLIIDRPLSEDIAILDGTICNFDNYTQAGAIAQRIWYSADQFETTFGFKPEGANQYAAPRENKDGQQKKKNGSGKTFYCVFEVWSKLDNTVYTICKGIKGYIREPYRPPNVSERWYPFFALGFNLVDGEFYPMSDVELLTELVDEYNTTRTNFAEHRKESLPVRIARAGGSLSPEDITRIQNRKINEVVVIQGASGKPLDEDLFEFKNIPLDPMVYDTTPIRADIDLVSGATDAARGAVVKAKTATEAEIMQQGLSARSAERQDAIEDWISEMSNCAAQILLDKLTMEDVVKVAGDEAVWPEMSKEQIYDLVQVEVRAGSTGKPNAARDQERWLKLLPLLQEAMVKVTELRAQGQYDMADAVVELVKETMRRFDERIDLDDFIPPAFGEGDPMAAMEKLEPEQRAIVQQMLAPMQQQTMMLQEQNQQLQEQLAQATDTQAQNQQKLIAQTQQADADRVSRENVETTKANTSAAVTQQKQANDHELAMDQAARDESLERARIASNERVAMAKAFADASAKVIAAQMAPTPGAEPGQAAVVPGEQEQQQTMMAIQAMVEQMQAGFAQLAAAISQPMIPHRGTDGLIEAVMRGKPN